MRMRDTRLRRRDLSSFLDEPVQSQDRFLLGCSDALLRQSLSVAADDRWRRWRHHSSGKPDRTVSAMLSSHRNDGLKPAAMMYPLAGLDPAYWLNYFRGR